MNRVPSAGRTELDEPPAVIVVGAGWAGLAAAVRLAESAMAVTLLEAAPQAGGRARAIPITLAQRTLTVDNGQHLLVGAYRECLTLAARSGMAGHALLRRPMQLTAVDGLHVSTPRLPAPFHLLAALIGARGIDWQERWALVRQLGGLRWRDWHAPSTRTVLAWLHEGRQPAALIRRFWEPLCIATLNTAPEAACAATFVRVLRDTLGGAREASDFLLPASSLSAVLPEPASAHLEALGAKLRLRTAALGLQAGPRGQGWRVRTAGGELPASAVILAVPPPVQVRLLQSLPQMGPARELLCRLAEFDYDAIATVYLAWPASVAPSLPASIMLTENAEASAFGQWFFARGVMQDLAVGAVVVSARGRRREDARELTAGIARQVARQLHLPEPLDSRIVTEKKATFQCTPDRPRVGVDTVDGQRLPWSGLWLAGDHAWPEYPATLESAVRSGLAAADAAIAAASTNPVR